MTNSQRMCVAMIWNVDEELVKRSGINHQGIMMTLVGLRNDITSPTNQQNRNETLIKLSKKY